MSSKKRYTIEETYETVEQIRQAKDTCVTVFFVFLFSDIGSSCVIREEAEFFFQVWQFLNEMERAA